MLAVSLKTLYDQMREQNKNRLKFYAGWKRIPQNNNGTDRFFNNVWLVRNKVRLLSYGSLKGISNILGANVQVEFANPTQYAGPNRYNPNNRRSTYDASNEAHLDNLFTKVTYKNHSILLLGDAHPILGNYLSTRCKPKHKDKNRIFLKGVTCFVASHHGSFRTGETSFLLAHDNNHPPPLFLISSRPIKPRDNIPKKGIEEIIEEDSVHCFIMIYVFGMNNKDKVLILA
ncbi:MAG: hypothetical protein LBQ03_02360 [Puniceicoccales bacterium]|nr:hypothetical protein [Puniceicoccales bacterium]